MRPLQVDCISALSQQPKIFHISLRKPLTCNLHFLYLQCVSVTRILSRKVCYIAEMDSSLSSPGKLKTDLDRVNILLHPLKRLVEILHNKSSICLSLAC